MAEDTILYELADGIATITFNRPQALNALLPDMNDRLPELIDRAEDDDAVRVLVLTGAGTAFSAGADIKMMGRPDRLGRSALVGRGSFTANIALKGQEGESYAAKGQLLVFNGEAKGKPVLFGQIYAAHPFATSFVITFEFSKIRKGEYGTALSATLPPALRSWGDLTGIQMNLARRYHYKGKSRSYISAGCPAPKGAHLASFRLARTSFAFSGGAQLSSTVSETCKARG